MCYFAAPCRAQRGTCCPAGLQTGAPRQGLPRGRGSQGKSIKPPDLQQLQDTRPSLQNLRNRIKNSQAGMIFIIIFLFVLHCAPTTAWGVISPSIPPRSPHRGEGQGGMEEEKRREGKEGRERGKARRGKPPPPPPESRLPRDVATRGRRRVGLGAGGGRAAAAAGNPPARGGRARPRQAVAESPAPGPGPRPSSRPRPRPRAQAPTQAPFPMTTFSS